MASKKPKIKMPIRKNYKTKEAFEDAMLKYMIKLEPEMFGFKVTQREQMNKGGMMKKYAKGGDIDDLSPDELMRIFMNLYRKGGGKKPTLAKKNKGGMMKKKGYAKGGATKKKKGYATGGMMPERKINPSTGMAMKKGGMIDMRKSGMFSKGGMTKKSPRGK